MPPCDVVVLAGDICPEFNFGPSQYDPDLQRLRQMQWLSEEFAEWEKDLDCQHIVAVPGNHDWMNRFPDTNRTKLYIDEGCEIDGKKFWFTPWIPYTGDWNYQLNRAGRKERFADIPFGLDLLVHHCPALGILDKAYTGELCGCPELRNAILDKRPHFSTFGHIHEGQRYGKTDRLGMTTMFHASMWGDKWVPPLFVI